MHGATALSCSKQSLRGRAQLHRRNTLVKTLHDSFHRTRRLLTQILRYSELLALKSTTSISAQQSQAPEPTTSAAPKKKSKLRKKSRRTSDPKKALVLGVRSPPPGSKRKTPEPCASRACPAPCYIGGVANYMRAHRGRSIKSFSADKQRPLLLATCSRCCFCHDHQGKLTSEHGPSRGGNDSVHRCPAWPACACDFDSTRYAGGPNAPRGAQWDRTHLAAHPPHRNTHSGSSGLRPFECCRASMAHRPNR